MYKAGASELDSMLTLGEEFAYKKWGKVGEKHFMLWLFAWPFAIIGVAAIGNAES